MEWSEVDLDDGVIMLDESTDVIDRERVTDTTKSGRSRMVSLDAGTVAVLREHRKRQLEERMKAGPAWHETGLVFTAGDGEAIFPDTVSLLMGKLIRDYNAPAIPGGGPRPQAHAAPAAGRAAPAHPPARPPPRPRDHAAAGRRAAREGLTCGFGWSGRGESNPHHELGKLVFYH